jgi:hypothetical protein
MSLVSLVIVLIVVGVLLWLVNTQIPMDANIKKIILSIERPKGPVGPSHRGIPFCRTELRPARR